MVMALVEAPLTSGEMESLMAPIAVCLAEAALKAGRVNRATRYVNIAYAIFDAHAEQDDDISASHQSSD